MKLRRVKIKNFRCLVDIDIPIADTTILIGENNAGKTAFLEALRIVFSRGLFGGKRVFDEFDFHMNKQEDTPETSPGIEIELTFGEDKPDEWSDELFRDIEQIIQTDPEINLDIITLKISSKYDDNLKTLENKAEFLNIQGQPLVGTGARSINNRVFAEYVRLFYLASLRDPENEFSPRSQFWGQILKDLNIDEKQQEKIFKSLARVNENILGADPRLSQVAKNIDNAQHIMDLGSDQSVSIQALPMTTWELLSRAGIVIKDNKSKIKLPIKNYGQGIQSLAVLFLFQSYIQIFLKPNFRPDTEAILELEEPEAHLHPQAIRSLSKEICQINGQKLISTHSPYFVQEIPLEHLRLFKRCDKGTKIFYIRRSFTTTINSNPGLVNFCSSRANRYHYSQSFQRLTISDKMTEDERRNLLPIFNGQPDAQSQINKLFEISQTYIPREDLIKLQNYVSRSRGDILFSKVWLLCEGQSEYTLLRYFSELINMAFDQSGVSVIDFQNNGDLESFILLAKSFDIPWMLTCDNDEEGKKFIQRAKKHCPVKLQKYAIKPLPKEYVDLEQFMSASFDSHYLTIMAENARSLMPRAKEWALIRDDRMSLVFLSSGGYEIREGKSIYSQTSPEYQDRISDMVTYQLRNDKVYSSQLLVEHLDKTHATEKDVPYFYKTLIQDVTKMAG